MNQAEQLTGKTMIHHLFGRVVVLSPLNGSRTKVSFRVEQRAKGWSELQGRYLPVKWFKPNRTRCGKEIGKTFFQKTYTDMHSQYGHVDECHINKLETLSNL